MWQRIKRMYYQWVIRNCQRDINELNNHLIEGNPDDIDVCFIKHDIEECRKAIKRARAKLC